MSGELYEPWTPPRWTAPMQLAFDAMRVENGGLTINLHKVGGLKRTVALAFPSLPLVIKMVNESHRLSSLALLPKPRIGSFYLVRNSELLESFNKDNLAIYATDPLLHLAVVTDEWIDLILAELPEVTC